MEITIETERVMVACNRKPTVIWCDGCAGRVTMLTVDDAATFAGASSRAVYRRVENGQLHFAETPEGRLFVCLNSLSRQTKSDSS